MKKLKFIILETPRFLLKNNMALTHIIARTVGESTTPAIIKTIENLRSKKYA